jgi:hypothetical protein
MQSNMALAVEFMGSVAINGVASVLEGSSRMLSGKGGIIAAASGSFNAAGSAIFGRMMSILASGTGADQAAFYMGYPTGSGFTIIGPLLNEQGVRENDPAKPGYLFSEQPATAVVNGILSYASYGSSAAGAIAPYPGCRVIMNNATGELNFVIPGGTVPAGYTQVQARVVAVRQFTSIIDIEFFSATS